MDDIKKYKINYDDMNNFETLVADSEKHYISLCGFIDSALKYNTELFELYQSYLISINKRLFCLKDFIKNSYDRIDIVKPIFENDANMSSKISACLTNLEKVFETYDYMCEQIDAIQKDYSAALTQYQLKNPLSKACDANMREMWEHTCWFHYDVVENIGEFIQNTVEPQLCIANALYEKELDFNKALNLPGDESTPQM